MVSILRRCDTIKTDLEGRAFVGRPLAGPLALQAQLHEELQQVDQQLVHHLLSLQVGRDVAQSVDDSQRAVPAHTHEAEDPFYSSQRQQVVLKLGSSEPRGSVRRNLEGAEVAKAFRCA